MNVVSNASPLISLARVGHLALRAVAGFRISDTLYHNVLHDMGEI